MNIIHIIKNTSINNITTNNEIISVTGRIFQSKIFKQRPSIAETIAIPKEI